ncbi:MAG TPA: murein biosynthesis integral membrane protein MurJ, partial [Candidatus Dormibacteraeota bacterium]|nr:murein biosynthesis integral membrane protein MurJ [Candidatus Dormibacteraeota bacterium]
MPSGDTAAPPAPDGRAERLNTRAAGVVGLAVLCSRVLGLAREQIFAALFGGGRVMDAFTMAFRIPNLLRDLFAEGALSTAFVTVFTRTAALEGDAAAWRLANKVSTLVALTLSALTILGIASAPWLVAGLAPGFDPDKAALTVTLTRVMYPFILLVSLAALVMGMLNARNVFGVPAMASSFFNLGSIIAGVALGYWLDPHFGTRAILGLAIGTLIGGALQLLVQLPLGVFGVALGTVALPLLARMAATGNTEAFRAELARGMRLAFLMTIPASIGLMVLAEPIISVLYQHGRFGAHETAESAAA